MLSDKIIKQTKKKLLQEKEEALARYLITEKYFVEKVESAKDKDSKRQDLVEVQSTIEELKNIIKFLRR